MRDNVSRLGTIYNALGLPANTTSKTSTVGVDLANYNAVAIYINAGTWTDGTHTFAIQESNDNGSTDAWANVAATDLVAWQAASATVFTPVRIGNSQPLAISSAATAINQRIGYIGGKRWIRLTVTVAAATTGAQYDAYIIAGEPRLMPSAV